MINLLNDVGIMKKYLFILVVVLILVGCQKEDKKLETEGDPLLYSHYIWQNDSDHRIRMTIYDKLWNEAGEWISGIEEEMLPGECIFREKSDIGWPPSPKFRKGIKMVFDDGPYGGNFPLSDSFVLPYDITQEKYFKRQREGDITKWIYTFTNADYDAAVARGPMKEQ